MEIDAQINEHIRNTGRQQQRLFAHPAHQPVHQRIGADAHYDADGQHDGGKALVQPQQRIHIEQQRAVKKRKARLHNQVSNRHYGKIAVRQGCFQALQQRHVAAFALHIRALVD